MTIEAECLPKNISRRHAVQILAEHGITPSCSTVTMDEENDGTSFDAEMGRREWYSLRAVLNWLGY